MINVFSSSGVACLHNEFGPALFATALQRHVTRYQFYNFVE